MGGMAEMSILQLGAFLIAVLPKPPANVGGTMVHLAGFEGRHGVELIELELATLLVRIPERSPDDLEDG